MDLSLAAGPLFRGFPRAATRLAQWSARAGALFSSEHRRRLERTAASLRAVGLYSEPLLAALARLPAEQRAEQRLLRHGTVDYVRSLQGEVTGIGLEPLIEAQRQGSGLILGCTHVGNFYHALIQIRRLGTDVMVVTGNRHYAPRTVARLAELSGARIRVVGAATSSTLAIARQLMRGGIVATMLDLYVDATIAIAAPLFGRPAATPAGIYQLAIAAEAPIAPLCVVTDAAGRKSVEIDSLIGPRATPLEFASAVNERIEAMVRRYPASWGVWDSLPYRWRKAAG
jgi:lauroyl/myristoyl acyltransferase